jgi:putative N6-adenine-specific DNA methylase
VVVQDDLYKNIKSIEWENYFEKDFTLAVDAVISDSVFTNSQFVSLKTKDAIVDRLREKWGTRPSIDLDSPDIRINVHLFKETCTVSLDSSGSSLHKRGYRQSAGLAPINEVLAAGLVQLSGWDRKKPFIDPMCGSGTILIEAAMFANNIPPGYFRQEFGFTRWRDFDPDLWARIKAEEDRKVVQSKTTIMGSDISEKAIQNSRENVRFAGLENAIQLKVSSFEEAVPPVEPGILVTNPPYDERLGLDDIIGFYRKIGDILKIRYSGYDAWVISSDLNALKFIGLHPSRKIPVFNGQLECRFVRFSMYPGKKY